jgi:hypothetical protein
MKRASLLVLAIACGGNSMSSQQATAPTQTAVASAAPAESSAAPQDNSPTPIGTKHKKVGNGWFLSGGGKDFYDAIYEPGAEPVVVVKQTQDPHGRWVTLMKNVSAAPYVGKKIRVRIGVKTTGATGRAEVWARAAAPHAAEDAPSTTTKLDPSSEMKTYEVTIDVKDGTRVVEYGASLAGDGELRVGKDSIDVL